ncbi:rhomboid family intramembrane serine protease [Mucilaginibacter antarcticus]|uniref:rhomboid family intramembrane serine protease n=1 Tax=Mucilaginibacter antarcticus TaxID=1855725 RepID=UPI003636A8A1
MEAIIGKARFVTAYLLTGIVASLVSLWWHDYTISAGASGAIFGLYGVFLAVLSTNYIERSLRNGVLASIGMFVVYNLVYGSFKGGIDNAAHIGGLLSGVVIGYLYVITLRKPDDRKLTWLILSSTIVIVFACSAFAYSSMSKNDRVIYYKRIQEFYKLEEKALAPIKKQEYQPDRQRLSDLNNSIGYWKSGVILIKELGRLKLSEKIHNRNELLAQYCQLRIHSYQLMHEAVTHETDMNSSKQQNINQQTKQVIEKLSSR